MKKILFVLGFVGLTAAGLATASAQYYNSYNYGAYNSSAYSSYTYPVSYNYSMYTNDYYGGIGSYTIGCTTYYYNTRTGASLGTYNVCTYTQPYYNNYTFTYPTQQQTTQYCTYMYRNGGWYPSCNNNNYYGGGGYNYINCHYNQYGQYVCW